MGTAKIQVLSEGAFKGISFTLDNDSYTLGRSENCNICIPDSTISGHHCSIYRKEDGQFYLRDDGSTNGTRMNTERVEPGVELKLRGGDIFQCGNVEIMFEEATPEMQSLVRAATVINLEDTGTATVSTVGMKNMGTRADMRKKAHLRDSGKQKLMFIMLICLCGIGVLVAIIIFLMKMFG